MLEAQLDEANVFKKSIEAIKDLVQDCNFDCNDAGIGLQAMDNSHVALVSMLLSRDAFSHYRCDRNIALGINLTSLTKVLRSAGDKDCIKFKAEDAPDVLHLLFEHPDSDRTAEYDLKLMDIDQEHLGIPDTDYAATIIMPSSEFKRIATDLMAMSESVNIEASKDGVKFSASGDIGSGSVSLRSNSDVENPKNSINIELNEPVSLTFSLKYLVNFCKAASLSDRVKVCLSNEVPLLVQYDMLTGSHLQFYLAPKVPVFSMQSLGCDVAALNTVQFSNHTGYRQWTGTRVSAQEITDLYRGLKQSYLDDFDMMLSGYVPGAAALEAVGQIAQELKARAKERGRPGSFFWVLDPVMGDNGNLYVAQDVVPVYRSLISHADLILPNQFEAELLSEVKIETMDSLAQAIQVMHERYKIPHIVITSVSLSHPDHPISSLSVVGSTMTSDLKARPFKIVFPAIDCYFSGTGDMFAALMVVRMREAVYKESNALMETESWRSDDSVDALDLPLAKAAEKVLASMHEVLTKTAEAMDKSMNKVQAESITQVDGEGGDEAQQTKLCLLKSKAAELRLVRHVDSLRRPNVEFRARKM
ncbi:proliferating cell nuclear antigen [Rhypophila decipiens]|uniref:DNA sliding clamp PCNA n=1 Tax=Rhypophila decipiens TaxID=261697 RepID=A0AAN7B9J5_9PEZI|nr:proliferating cell nuclear antigen [Rhypophila decipiens]